MKCEDITTLSYYLDNELSKEERLEVETHLHTCASCAKRLTLWQKNDELVRRTLQLSKPSSDLVQRVIALLPVQRKPSLRKVLKYAGLLSAALLLIFVGVVIYINSQSVAKYDIILYGQTTFQSKGNSSVRLLVKDPTGKGVPIKRTSLEIRSKEGETYPLGKFDADTDGVVNCNFTLPDLLPGEYRLVTSVGSYTINNAVTVKRDFKILLTTDKPIYQPNQVIHMRLLSLTNFNLTPLQKRTALFEVEDPKGNKVYKKEVETSEFGIASCDFQLADEINLGYYRLTATIEGIKSEKVVDVKRYVLPKFRLDVTTDKTFYQPGERIKGSIKAEYFFGKPVSKGGVEITLAAYLVDKWTPVEKLKETLDENGVATFETVLPKKFFGTELAKGDAILSLTVEVADNAEHREKKVHSVTVSQDILKLSAIPEGGAVVYNIENVIYFVTAYPDGSPAQTEITLSNGAKLQTGENGIARIKLKVDNKLLNYTVRDKMGNRASGKLNFVISANDFVLRTDKVSYKGGETMSIVVVSGYPSGTVYLDIVKSGQTILTKTLPIKDGRGELLFDVPVDLFGIFQLNAYKIRSDGNIARDSRIIFVDLPQNLTIRPTLDKKQYKPGEQIKINFEVVDERGRPTQSALGITAVDEAVYALQENRAGLEKVYFALEEDLLKPRYQIKGCPTPEVLITPPPQTISPEVLVAVAAKSETVNPLGRVNSADAERKLRQEIKEFNDTIIEIAISIVPIAALIFVAIPIVIALVVFCIWLYKLCFRAFKRDWIRITIWSLFPPVAILEIYLILHFIYDMDLSFRDDIWPSLALLATIGAGGGIMVLFFWGITWLRSRSRRLYYLSRLGVISVLVLICMFMFLMPGISRSRISYEKIMLTSPTAIASGRREKLSNIGGDSSTFFPSAEAPSDFASTSDVRSKKSSSDDSSPRSALQDKTSFRLRQYFPEALLWQPELITDKWGRASLIIDKPADSITTWRMVSQAVSRDGRLGSHERGINVFQDFFIDLDLPVTLMQQDEVSIPIAIYNYLKKNQTIALQFERGNWFELLEASDTKELTLGASDIGVRYFRIRVKEVGLHTLTVYAAGSEGLKDAIRRQIQVLPNGREYEINISDRLDKECIHRVSIPKNAIDNASVLLVRLYPGRFSEVVQGLEGLVRLPYG